MKELSGREEYGQKQAKWGAKNIQRPRGWKELGCSSCGGNNGVTGAVCQEDMNMETEAGTLLFIQALICHFLDLGLHSTFSKRPLKFNVRELHA